MKIVVTDADPMGKVDFSRLNSLGEVTYHPYSDVEDVIPRCKEADIIITNKVVINKEVIDACSNLKLICISATGTDNVDVKYAESKDIPVKNVSGYSTYSVAQHTFSMLLYIMQSLKYFDDYVKEGEYFKSKIFTNLGREYHEIRGKVVGIIGLGNIGRQVAKIADAFGATVIFYNRSEKDTPYKQVALEELATEADIITIHTPLNEGTKNLIDKDLINKMKKSAIIINVARGGIVNEEDIAEALNNDRIAALGTDVFSAEPAVKSNPLFKVKDSEKIYMTPHIAWASIESRKLLLEKVCDNIEKFQKEFKKT